ncbi:hypothetical protein [Streptomyces sp. NPDC049040]|uniref:hypothetical protein n=1 Tax=Streptomyces sp. NPDC049040 TaxID=3365593 RepID=UPI003710E97C
MPSRSRRLPRDLSWPLTATDIRSALGEQESDLVELRFGNVPYDDGTLLHADWTPPLSSNYGAGVHPSLWNSVAIRVAPLPPGERAAARRILRTDALPELATWIHAARRAPQGWTLTRHSRSWRLAGSITVHRDDRQPYR